MVANIMAEGSAALVQMAAAKRAVIAVERKVREAGLSFTQFTILCALAENNGRANRATDLSNKVYMSRSALTHQLAELERKGLLERRWPADGQDRRTIIVVLTEEGRRMVEALAGR